MKHPLINFLIAASAFAGVAAAAAPPTPTYFNVAGVNRHAEVIWQTVPQTNRYEVWSRANDGAPLVKFGEYNAARTGAQFHLSLHLVNWEQMRWQLRACNPSGCSSSEEKRFYSSAVGATAFIKPSRTQVGAKFGSAIDLSEDGKTLVSVSESETDTQSGRQSIVNIYLFNSFEAERWKQEARIFPSVTQPNNGRGVVANLSANGSVLVVGIPSQRSSAAASAPETGGAYLFRRLANGQWRQDVRFTPALTGVTHYGAAAEISEDARTVMIGYEKDGGTAEMYHLRDDGLYELATVIPGPGGEMGCTRIRLSGDGNTVARSCTRPPYVMQLQVFRGPSFALEFADNIFSTDEAPLKDMVVDYAGQTFAWSGVGSGQFGQQIVGYRRYENGVVTRNSFPTNTWKWQSGTGTPAPSEFGGRLAISRDGTYVAVRDVLDTGQGTGPVPFPLAPGSASTGAVFIYQYYPSTNSLGGLPRRVLKPNYGAPAGGYSEGELAFANNGRTLAASQPGDTSGATTPYHWYSTEVKPDAGAVTIY